MSAGRYDLKIEKGARLVQTFAYLDDAEEPIDLSGYEGRFTIRTPDADGAIVAGFDLQTSDTAPAIAVGGGDDANEIEVDLSALLTVDGPADGCKGWYTLKVWPPGEPENADRIAEGYVRWSPESSRDDA